MLKLDKTFQRLGNFYNLSFFPTVQIWVLRVKKYFCSFQFLVDIFPIRSGSVDLYIFVDPDQRSQNLADPTDPDVC